MRRLIINADDFGYTRGVNRAIVEAHTRGVVTSCTLMANGPAFADAVQKLKDLPQLSVGCHVVLIDGEALLSVEQVRSLTTTRGQTSRFRDGLKSFAVRALSGKFDPNEIAAEVSAQIRKLQIAGVAVSHVDTHKHTHLFPAMLRPLLRAAQECGVHAIRNPFGPRRPLKSGELLARPNLWTRYAEVRIFRTLSNRFREAVKRQGMATPEGTLGVEVTGTLDEKLFRCIAETIPPGTWEFVCHPGYNDDELKSAKTRLRESRETELRVLTMPESREILAGHDVELISYRELTSA